MYHQSGCLESLNVSCPVSCRINDMIDMIYLLECSFILNYKHSMALYNSYAYIIRTYVIHKTDLLKHSEAVHYTVIVIVDGKYLYR